MLVEAQIDMIENDDWDHLFDTEIDNEQEVERKMEQEYSSQP